MIIKGVSVKHCLAVQLCVASFFCSMGEARNPNVANLGSVPMGQASTAVRVVPWATLPGDIQQMTHQGSDLYFATREGRVWKYDQLGNRETTAFLDLNAALPNRFRVNPSSLAVSAGLRGLAFHPDFDKSGSAGEGKFFTLHAEEFNSATPNHALNPQWDTDGTKMDSVLAEWIFDPITGLIDPASSREVYRVQFPFGRHPGQQIAFNPAAREGDADYGNLYMTFGDAGSDNSDNVINFNRVQGTDSVLGTIARINPLQSGSDSFTVPSDNPFVGPNDGAIDEIYAYGFRHPQTIGFDPLDGRLFTGDMGQNNIEEINLVEPGKNYGYGTREGTYLFTDQVQGSTDADDSLREIDLTSSQNYFVKTDDNPTGSTQTVLSRTDDEFTYAVAQFDHQNEGRGVNKNAAVVGGSVYRGTRASELENLYLFGNLSSDAVYYANADDLVNDEDPAPIFRLPLLDSSGQPKTLGEIVGVGSGNRANMRFGQDAHGDLYLISKSNDTIYQLVGTPEIAGDFNRDGSIDAADFVIWRDSLGSEQNLWADANRDFVVDDLDYALWSQNFGSAPASFGLLIPEPAGLLLALLGISFAMLRDKRLVA